jgi:uncharacterized protein
MIERNAAAKLRRLAGQFPAVTVTGPRQSGKTTLCRALFPNKPYVSLEAPDRREHASGDPRDFLSAFPDGAIIDEVQRAPELPSYLQEILDEHPTPGRFILTGSANFAVLSSVGQSLAGRTALLTLLPLALDEVRRFPAPPAELSAALWHGTYPAIYDRGLDPTDWYAAYVANYVERDVRQIVNVTDLGAFQTFLRMCAGRCAQLVNLSALAADCGITHNTARAWLSVLEASYVAFRLPPFHANLTSRLVKTPKLHFFDPGLCCYLLGIMEPDQLRSHPLRGALFETWVVSEIYKKRVHSGLPPALSFYRDAKGLEVDVIVEGARRLTAVEIKSGQTIAADFFRPLTRFSEHMKNEALRRGVDGFLVYGGEDRQRRGQVTVLPWQEVAELDLP